MGFVFTLIMCTTVLQHLKTNLWIPGPIITPIKAMKLQAWRLNIINIMISWAVPRIMMPWNGTRICDCCKGHANQLTQKAVVDAHIYIYKICRLIDYDKL